MAQCGGEARKWPASAACQGGHGVPGSGQIWPGRSLSASRGDVDQAAQGTVLYAHRLKLHEKRQVKGQIRGAAVCAQLILRGDEGQVHSSGCRDDLSVARVECRSTGLEGVATECDRRQGPRTGPSVLSSRASVRQQPLFRLARQTHCFPELGTRVFIANGSHVRPIGVGEGLDGVHGPLWVQVAATEALLHCDHSPLAGEPVTGGRRPAAV
mmetsp:Transcript_19819/g.27260  ORF Transcript_19819/g.27260 Transcript_19819/m.27260 type:complete len:212 (+) Transcript_19819:2150-2785(+)